MSDEYRNWFANFQRALLVSHDYAYLCKLIHDAAGVHNRIPQAYLSSTFLGLDRLSLRLGAVSEALCNFGIPGNQDPTVLVANLAEEVLNWNLSLSCQSGPHPYFPSHPSTPSSVPRSDSSLGEYQGTTEIFADPNFLYPDVHSGQQEEAIPLVVPPFSNCVPIPIIASIHPAPHTDTPLGPLHTYSPVPNTVPTVPFLIYDNFPSPSPASPSLPSIPEEDNVESDSSSRSAQRRVVKSGPPKQRRLVRGSGGAVAGTSRVKKEYGDFSAGRGNSFDPMPAGVAAATSGVEKDSKPSTPETGNDMSRVTQALTVLENEQKQLLTKHEELSESFRQHTVHLQNKSQEDEARDLSIHTQLRTIITLLSGRIEIPMNQASTKKGKGKERDETSPYYSRRGPE